MKIDHSEIRISGIRCYARHGLFEQERRVGNLFLVDLVVRYDALEGMESDTLTGTIDYSLLYDLVRTEMDIPSDLIENVAYRILTHIHAEFPEVHSAEVSITKCTPPIPGFDAEGVTFTASARF